MPRPRSPDPFVSCALASSGPLLPSPLFHPRPPSHLISPLALLLAPNPANFPSLRPHALNLQRSTRMHTPAPAYVPYGAACGMPGLNPTASRLHYYGLWTTVTFPFKIVPQLGTVTSTTSRLRTAKTFGPSRQPLGLCGALWQGCPLGSGCFPCAITLQYLFPCTFFRWGWQGMRSGNDKQCGC